MEAGSGRVREFPPAPTDPGSEMHQRPRAANPSSSSTCRARATAGEATGTGKEIPASGSQDKTRQLPCLRRSRSGCSWKQQQCWALNALCSVTEKHSKGITNSTTRQHSAPKKKRKLSHQYACLIFCLVLSHDNLNSFT